MFPSISAFQTQESNATNKTKGTADLSDKDIISNLHESILSHILSFLPIEDAVRTSVLSKRWKHIWTTITDLNFDDRHLSSDMETAEKQNYISCVYKVISQLTSTMIHSFHLFLSSMHKYDPSDVSLLISYILSQTVQKLYIHYTEKSCKIPYSLFDCFSLEMLYLNMKGTLRFRSSNCLTNLRVLKFLRLKIKNCSPHSRELVLSFPVLEEFEAESCTWIDVQNVIIQTPLLKSCSLKYSEFIHSYKKVTGNFAIMIFASDLRNFSYEGFLIEDIELLTNPSSVRRASLDLTLSACGEIHNLQQKGLRIYKLLNGFRSVEFLKMGCHALEVLGFADDCISALPVFETLVCLKLGLAIQFAKEIVLDLLHKSPNLQRLVLKSEISKFNKKRLSLKEVPQCFHSSLKVVEFRSYNKDYKVILYLAKYVLKNSQSLEKMTISLSEYKNEMVPFDRLEQELRLFQKMASRSATIKVGEMEFEKICRRTFCLLKRKLQRMTHNLVLVENRIQMLENQQ